MSSISVEDPQREHLIWHQEILVVREERQHSSEEKRRKVKIIEGGWPRE